MQPTTTMMFAVGVVALISWMLLIWRLNGRVPSVSASVRKGRRW